MNMGNWTKMTVVIGGTGDITLGAVTGFPTVAETIGTGLSFYYAFLNTNLSPIEIGNGQMLDAITLQRDVIEATMVAGVYTDDGLTAANIPAGALLFTAPTKDMLIDFILQMPFRDYGNVTGATEISLLNKAIKINCTGNTTLTFADLPPDDVYYVLTMVVTVASNDTTLTLPADVAWLDGNVVTLTPNAPTELNFMTVDGGTTWKITRNENNALVNLGSVSGPVDIDVSHANIALNLTNDTTLSFNSTPLAGFAHSFSFEVTSNNAGSADITKGYKLTLPASCTIGKNQAPALPIAYGVKNIIHFRTVDGGTTYQVIIDNPQMMINDLGDIGDVAGATMTLDVRHPQSKANLIASTQPTLTFSGISPAAQFGEAAHFVFKNSGDGAKNLVFDADVFTIVGSTINAVTVLLGYKADFTIRKNPLANDAVAAYDVWMNGINYDVTASGLATIFNPSDAGPAIILSNSNKTVTRTGSGGLNYSGVRAFGGKNSGKWRFSVRCDGILAAGGGGSISSVFQLGIAAAGVNLSQTTGLGVSGGFVAIVYVSSTNAALNAVYGVLVDFELNKIWGTINGAPVSGNPEAGTGGTDIFDGTMFYPSVFMKTASSGGNAGLWTAMNEIEDPFVTTWPSFNTWTA